MRYLPINKWLIPHVFSIRLAGKTYKFVVKYNPQGDFFTVDLYQRGKLLAAGVKIVYGAPLFADFTDPDFPDVELIPIDMSDQYRQVTWDNFGESVRVYILEGF